MEASGGLSWFNPEMNNENSEAFKTGISQSRNKQQRIKRAGESLLKKKNSNSNWNKDVGFRVLKIDTSNMADVYYTPGEVKQEDLLVPSITSSRGGIIRKTCFSRCWSIGALT